MAVNSTLGVVASLCQASLVAQMLNLLAIQETWVPSLDWEEHLEKEMETDSSILAWRITWPEEPGGLHSPWGHKELDTSERLTLCISVPVFFLYKCSDKYSISLLGLL